VIQPDQKLDTTPGTPAPSPPAPPHKAPAKP